METVTVDGVEYQLNELTDEVREQVMNIRFVDEQILQRNNELQVAQTAKMGYTLALKRELNKWSVMPRVDLDGVEYELDVSNEQAVSLVQHVQNVNEKIQETKNMIAILTKAKRAYISELKSEMLSAKAGFDFESEWRKQNAKNYSWRCRIQYRRFIR